MSTPELTMFPDADGLRIELTGIFEIEHLDNPPRRLTVGDDIYKVTKHEWHATGVTLWVDELPEGMDVCNLCNEVVEMGMILHNAGGDPEGCSQCQ